MAKAKKCDRCGQFYEKNIKRIYLTSNYNSDVVLAGVKLLDTSEVGHNTYSDLCDTCITKLVCFLEGDELDPACDLMQNLARKAEED